MRNNDRRISTDNINNFLLGFDSVFSDMLSKQQYPNNYPPHNIYKLSKDDPYSDMVIEIALAGISKHDVNIAVTDEEMLKVEYNGNADEPADIKYVHKGISARKFVLEWRMNKDLEVEEASWNDRMLRIKIANHAGRKGSCQTIPIK